jgi:hypothetical protein
MILNDALGQVIKLPFGDFIYLYQKTLEEYCLELIMYSSSGF